MRIPKSAPFVFFQFRKGERVMFSSGPRGKKEFAALVNKFHARITGNTFMRYLCKENPVVIPKNPVESCVIYRSHSYPPSHFIWTNISEDNLNELCRTFGDWVAKEAAAPEGEKP